MSEAADQALFREGVAALQRRDFALAEANLREVLSRHPHQPGALGNLGLLLTELERHDEALALADAALAADPRHGQALMMRGNALTSLARYEEALAPYAQATAVPAVAHDALTKIGLAQAALGRYDGARAALDRAIAQKPGDALAHFRRGIVRLTTRDFGGWSDYEARWSLGAFLATSGGMVTPAMAQRLTRNPTADDLRGQRVLLLGEQGVGDQIMFASLIGELAALAASVTCICEPRLVRLFRASVPGVTFSGPQDARVGPADVDRLVAMGSLGGLFRPTEGSFPGAPYLTPTSKVRDGWADRLGPRRRPRVGISWRGGTPGTRRHLRSLTLADLAPVLDLDAEFISLQYGDPRPEIEAFNASRANPVRAFEPYSIDDFEDLAGLVGNLDAVVSVQTAAVHLTGAMGVPCFTLVPYVPEWRYTSAGPAMPWYGSVRLLRQSEPSDWTPVIRQAADALRAQIGD